MKTTYSITGMHCESCVKKIETQIRPYVQEIQVTLHPPRAVMTNESVLNLDELNNELKKIGKYIFSEEKKSANTPNSEVKSWFKTYQPLLVIVLMITLVSAQSWPNREAFMLNFMAGFFIVFGN